MPKQSEDVKHSKKDRSKQKRPAKAQRVKGLRVLPKVVLTRNSPNQSARSAAIELIVLHSTESHNRKGHSDLEAIAGLFANSSFDASSHTIVDADGFSARCVPDERKAWTVGNLNSASLNIEQIGFAAQGRPAWRHRKHQLRETARWIALWSRRHGIPIRKAVLSGSGQVIRAGVTTHDYCSKHGAGTTHWDPGEYPMGYVLWLARGFKWAQIAARRKA